MGEIFGLLGDNRAGKATTIRLLTGVLTPSVGDASVFGLSPEVAGTAIRLEAQRLCDRVAVLERGCC